MNLLIDFLTANGRYGAGEYHRRVVMSLIERIELDSRTDVKLFALFDSHVSISFDDMRADCLGMKYGITYLDLHEKSLLEIINEYSIDRFFIACGQRIGLYPEIANVKCDVVCVTHDLLYEEWYSNHMYQYWNSLKESDEDAVKEYNFLQRLRLLYGRMKNDIRCQLRIFRNGVVSQRQGKRELSYMNAVVQMVNNNHSCTNIMVSEYSKRTMMYNFGIPSERILVLYSPERINCKLEPIQNESLRNLIDTGKKYYLMVSADRECKNPIKSAKAFAHYSELDKEAYFVMVGNKRTPLSDRQINMEFLSDSDLAHAMMNCYALVYPSFFEGFGYPPLEAMRYGKPVLCSNVTSIPEILGVAPIYFSPFYESSIFDAFMRLNENNYDEYSKKSLFQYGVVAQRQENDLKHLVEILLRPLNTDVIL